jgi:hypothetical protein
VSEVRGPVQIWAKGGVLSRIAAFNRYGEDRVDVVDGEFAQLEALT